MSRSCWGWAFQGLCGGHPRLSAALMQGTWVSRATPVPLTAPLCCLATEASPLCHHVSYCPPPRAHSVSWYPSVPIRLKCPLCVPRCPHILVPCPCLVAPPPAHSVPPHLVSPQPCASLSPVVPPMSRCPLSCYCASLSPVLVPTKAAGLHVGFIVPRWRGGSDGGARPPGRAPPGRAPQPSRPRRAGGAVRPVRCSPVQSRAVRCKQPRASGYWEL